MTGVPCEWAVVDDDGIPHPQASRWLAYLEDVEYAAKTRRTYAYNLAHYLTFMDAEGLDLDDVSNVVLGRFARYMRSPSPTVVSMSDDVAQRKRSTTNDALTTVATFYRFLGSQGRGSVGYRGYKRLEDSAKTYRRPERTVIDNVGKASAYREGTRLGPRLPTVATPVKTLTVQEVHAILRACRTYRERLFFMLAFSTGLRIGQILGLRHSDINTRTQTISIVPGRENENGAAVKTKKHANLPAPREVTRLYLTYMHEEYGHIDSDYVFVSFTKGRVGNALTPSTTYGWVKRIRKETGVTDWTPHSLRHTFVTLQRRAGVPIDVISHLVTHANIQTTVDIYTHLDVEDLRKTLIDCGAWESDTDI